MASEIRAPSSRPGGSAGAEANEGAIKIARKYGERGYEPEADAWEGEAAGGLVRFTPHKALAWFDDKLDWPKELEEKDAK